MLADAEETELYQMLVGLVHDLPDGALHLVVVMHLAVLKAGAPGSDRLLFDLCTLGPVVAAAAGASPWAAAATLDRERAGARVR